MCVYLSCNVVFTNSKGNRCVFIFLVMSSLPILKVIDVYFIFLVISSLPIIKVVDMCLPIL